MDADYEIHLLRRKRDDTISSAVYIQKSARRSISSHARHRERLISHRSFSSEKNLIYVQSECGGVKRRDKPTDGRSTSLRSESIKHGARSRYINHLALSGKRFIAGADV
jgi:hypothetical protein